MYSCCCSSACVVLDLHSVVIFDLPSSIFSSLPSWWLTSAHCRLRVVVMTRVALQCDLVQISETCSSKRRRRARVVAVKWSQYHSAFPMKSDVLPWLAAEVRILRRQLESVQASVSSRQVVQPSYVDPLVSCDSKLKNRPFLLHVIPILKSEVCYPTFLQLDALLADGSCMQSEFGQSESSECGSSECDVHEFSDSVVETDKLSFIPVSTTPQASKLETCIPDGDCAAQSRSSFVVGLFVESCIVASGADGSSLDGTSSSASSVS